MPRKLVKSIAVLAAAAALTSSAATGVASAAPAKSAGATKSQATKGSKKPARRAEGRGTKLDKLRGPRGGVLRVKGTSTGKGPATNAECAQIAADIDTAFVAAEDYALDDDFDSVDNLMQAVDEMTAKGVKRGCAFAY